uniref:Protein kinase domain-containing protein n=1 Tax=Neogobius melanostomus TaxID=47308 RepID=A0A8C6T248_9GOBI
MNDEDELVEQFFKAICAANHNFAPSTQSSITDSTLVSKHSYYDSFEGIMSLLSDYKVEEGNDPADMYNLLELMGEGYFGKVIKCLNKETCEIVAVKEIKMCENVDQVVAKELYMLDKVSALDPDADNIIRFNKYFKTADGHHCMEFELLDLSVDKFMKRRQAKFSLNEIRSMAKDLLISLKGLQSVGVMHTDVKPDNIMYVDQKNKPFRVKLIDFGVAIPKEQAQVGKIMQPLGYRAPEVTLGLPLTEAVDMWSLGCCLLEWYLSAIPFPCYSPYDHIHMITHLIGVPDGGLIEQAMYGNDYFDLKDVIQNYLLQKMFHVDPDKRITPAEALSHPFITVSSRMEMPSTSTQGIEKMPENANEELSPGSFICWIKSVLWTQMLTTLSGSINISNLQMDITIWSLNCWISVLTSS